MTDVHSFFAEVRSIIARYLDGDISDNSAIELLVPLMRKQAEAEKDDPMLRPRAPGDPIKITTLSAGDWQKPGAGIGGVVFTHVPLAPGRPREDEEKAITLLERARERIVRGK